MTNRDRCRLVCLLFFIAAVSLAGCKKHIAAAPPAPPPVQPAPPPPAPTITLRAAPNNIDRGQALNLQWEAKNATSVRIQPEVGSVAVGKRADLVVLGRDLEVRQVFLGGQPLARQAAGLSTFPLG